MRAEQLVRCYLNTAAPRKPAKPSNNMPFADALEIYLRLNAEHDAASKALNAIPGVGSGANGRTPMDVMFSARFRQAKANYEIAAAKLRDFNKSFVKDYKKELRQYYDEKKRKGTYGKR